VNWGRAIAAQTITLRAANFLLYIFMQVARRRLGCRDVMCAPVPSISFQIGSDAGVKRNFRRLFPGIKTLMRLASNISNGSLSKEKRDVSPHLNLKIV